MRGQRNVWSDRGLSTCLRLIGAAVLLLLAVGAVGTATGQEVTLESVGTERVRLSHTDPKRCLQMLQIFGYSIGQPGTPVDLTALPCAVEVPPTTAHTVPTAAKGTGTFPLTDTDTINELLVFYDPAKPEQLSALVDRIRTLIDVPARQIMIECMVLEIASGALEQLGVEWGLDHGTLSEDNWFGKHTDASADPPLRIGSVKLPGGGLIDGLTPDGSSERLATVDATFTSIFREFKIKLQALVKNNTARIVSRPSVLTLDNRMAYINVSEKIPVANSAYHASGQFQSINFRELNVGIELTVRPRVSEDGEEIGMQISASVTDEVPDEEVVVSGKDGTPLAVSPTLSVREVRTYARIANDTPFIIGGLIAQDERRAQRKVPWLGDAPVIGPLFRTKHEEDGKREVIIVITPHVLPEERIVARTLPKDEDAFDNFGNELFRDAYRIRAEDAFNLRFLTENRQLVRLQKIADEIVAENLQLADVYPFSRFCRGRVPGDSILVRRQMYEVIKRRKLDEEIDEAKMIFFQPGEQIELGFSVKWLARHLKALARKEPGFGRIVSGKDEGRDKALRTKALAMTYVPRQQSEKVVDALREPVPELTVVDCPKRETWTELLWELNQPAEDGLQRHTILLRDEKDLVRLKRAILLRRTVELNARSRELTLQSFSVGRTLLLPTAKEEKVYLIDTEAAKSFFYTELYYPAVEKVLEADIEAFTTALQQPGFSEYAPAAK